MCKVATSYAASGSAPLVFEIGMGMVDRGASLSWLSQYPHEQVCLCLAGRGLACSHSDWRTSSHVPSQEILFAPLTGLEVQDARVNVSVMVIEMRLSVNMNNATIEEVVAKMQSSALSLASLASAASLLSPQHPGTSPPPHLSPLTPGSNLVSVAWHRRRQAAERALHGASPDRDRYLPS